MRKFKNIRLRAQWPYVSSFLIGLFSFNCFSICGEIEFPVIEKHSQDIINNILDITKDCSKIKFTEFEEFLTTEEGSLILESGGMGEFEELMMSEEKQSRLMSRLICSCAKPTGVTKSNAEKELRELLIENRYHQIDLHINNMIKNINAATSGGVSFDESEATKGYKKACRLETFIEDLKKDPCKANSKSNPFLQKNSEYNIIDQIKNTLDSHNRIDLYKKDSKANKYIEKKAYGEACPESKVRLSSEKIERIKQKSELSTVLFRFQNNMTDAKDLSSFLLQASKTNSNDELVNAIQKSKNPFFSKLGSLKKEDLEGASFNNLVGKASRTTIEKEGTNSSILNDLTETCIKSFSNIKSLVCEVNYDKKHSVRSLMPHTNSENYTVVHPYLNDKNQWDYSGESEDPLFETTFSQGISPLENNELIYRSCNSHQSMVKKDMVAGSLEYQKNEADDIAFTKARYHLDKLKELDSQAWNAASAMNRKRNTIADKATEYSDFMRDACDFLPPNNIPGGFEGLKKEKGCYNLESLSKEQKFVDNPDLLTKRIQDCAILSELSNELKNESSEVYAHIMLEKANDMAKSQNISMDEALNRIEKLEDLQLSDKPEDKERYALWKKELEDFKNTQDLDIPLVQEHDTEIKDDPASWFVGRTTKSQDKENSSIASSAKTKGVKLVDKDGDELNAKLKKKKKSNKLNWLSRLKDIVKNVGASNSGVARQAFSNSRNSSSPSYSSGNYDAKVRKSNKKSAARNTKNYITERVKTKPSSKKESTLGPKAGTTTTSSQYVDKFKPSETQKFQSAVGSDGKTDAQRDAEQEAIDQARETNRAYEGVGGNDPQDVPNAGGSAFAGSNEGGSSGAGSAGAPIGVSNPSDIQGGEFIKDAHVEWVDGKKTKSVVFEQPPTKTTRKTLNSLAWGMSEHREKENEGPTTIYYNFKPNLKGENGGRLKVKIGYNTLSYESDRDFRNQHQRSKRQQEINFWINELENKKQTRRSWNKFVNRIKFEERKLQETK